MHPCPQVQYNVILSGHVINLWKMEEAVEKLTEKCCATAIALSKIRFPADKLQEFFPPSFGCRSGWEVWIPWLLRFSANKCFKCFVRLGASFGSEDGSAAHVCLALLPPRWCLWSEAASVLPFLGLEQFAETEGGIYSPTGIGGWHKLFW